MQPLNYAASAARGLERFLEGGKKELRRLIDWGEPVPQDMARDIFSCERLLDLLRLPQCEHFQLPEGGHIFNDALKGIKGKPINLPYPLISVSYRVGADIDGETFDGSKLLYVPKRVAVAIELPRDKLPYGSQDVFPGCDRICMIMALFCTHGEEWKPCMSVALLPTDKWDGTGYEGPTADLPTFMKEPSGNAFMGKVCIMLPWHFQAAVRRHGDDYAHRSLYHDIAGEASAVLELCEALTCSNVSEAVIQEVRPRVNIRRAKEGKLPLWTTKVLTVKVPRRREEKPWQGGHHDTPGYHLCSGYIRRVPWSNGTENQWIQDYARGDPAKGIIKKTYRITT